MRDPSEGLYGALQTARTLGAGWDRSKRSYDRVQNLKDMRAGADEVTPEEVDPEECQCYASVDLDEVENVAQP